MPVSILPLVSGVHSMHEACLSSLAFFLICLKADFPSLILLIVLCRTLLVWKHSRVSLRRKKNFPYQLCVIEQTGSLPARPGFPTAWMAATWGVFVSNHRREGHSPEGCSLWRSGMFLFGVSCSPKAGTSPLGNKAWWSLHFIFLS